MFKIFMLSVWAAGAFYLVKSYSSGLTQMATFQRVCLMSFKDTALAGPWEGFKDPSDVLFWYNFGAVLTLVIYVFFTKQVIKEFI